MTKPKPGKSKDVSGSQNSLNVLVSRLTLSRSAELTLAVFRKGLVKSSRVCTVIPDARDEEEPSDLNAGACFKKQL